MTANRTVERLGTVGLGFGGAPVGNLYRAIDDATAHEAVEAAWGGGLRYFDTAPHYGLGLSERRLGAVLADKPRDEFLLSTKVGRLIRPAATPQEQDDEGFAVPGDLARVRDYSAGGVRRSLVESLERMGLDRFDIVFIHDPDDHWQEAVDGAVPELERMRSEGIIGAWGAGMNQWEMLHRFVTETDIDVIMLAGRYTLLDQSAREDLIPACAQRGVGIVDVGVYNSGILANPDPAQHATFNYAPAEREVLERAQALAALCAEFGTTLPAAAIAFVERDPAITNVTLGMRTREQVLSNLAHVSRPFPEEFWAAAVQRQLIAVDPATLG
jgi:D-threo-aldose 1-dehydrogenase